MKYSILLLIILVAGCQQPTTTSYLDTDVSAKRGASSVIAEASGVVTWTNKPGHAGKITGANGLVYQYNVNAGHTVDGFRPKVGDAVLFQAGPGAVARFIRLGQPDVDDDNGDGDGTGDDGGDNGDGDGGDPEEPACPPGQYLAADGNCYFIPS